MDRREVNRGRQSEKQVQPTSLTKGRGSNINGHFELTIKWDPPIPVDECSIPLPIPMKEGQTLVYGPERWKQIYIESGHRR